MPRLEHLPERARNTILTFPAQVNTETPWTPLRRPLSQARVALVTTAGLHLKGDMPFVTDHETPDQSYRRLPSDAPSTEIVQSHTSIGFDRTGIQRDLNVTYPVACGSSSSAAPSAAWQTTSTPSWVRCGPGTCSNMTPARRSPGF